MNCRLRNVNYEYFKDIVLSRSLEGTVTLYEKHINYKTDIDFQKKTFWTEFFFFFALKDVSPILFDEICIFFVRGNEHLQTVTSSASIFGICLPKTRPGDTLSSNIGLNFLSLRNLGSLLMLIFLIWCKTKNLCLCIFNEFVR